jgi:hypothetical protein
MSKISKKPKIVRNGTNQSYVKSNTAVILEQNRPKKEAAYMSCNFGGAF